MNSTNPEYPQRLFEQPDFDLLFKYFPEKSWPKDNVWTVTPFPKMLPEKVPYVRGYPDERKAFWDGFRDPYNTQLIEQRHDVKFFVERWDLKGYAENEEGGLNGILNWEPKPKIDARQKVWDMEKEYLIPDRDLSAELFAIHWWLTQRVKTDVDLIRQKPFLTKDQLKAFKTDSGSPELKSQYEGMILKDLEQLIGEYEKELGFTKSKTEEQRKSISEKLTWVKGLLLEHKSSRKAENKERQKLGRFVIEFLEKENVCRSKTGIYMVGAFLIFSSGLSFRKTKGEPNLEFDQEFAKKLKECLSPSKPKG